MKMFENQFAIYKYSNSYLMQDARWFGHLECKNADGRSADDWVSACRNVEVVAGWCEDDLRRMCE